MKSSTKASSNTNKKQQQKAATTCKKTTIHTKNANQNNSGRKSACATRQRAQFAIQLHSCTLSYVLGIVYRLSFSVFCSSVRRSFVRSLSLRPLITTHRFVTSRHVISCHSASPSQKSRDKFVVEFETCF